jgi:hypothetical protein
LRWRAVARGGSLMAQDTRRHEEIAKMDGNFSGTTAFAFLSVEEFYRWWFSLRPAALARI